MRKFLINVNGKSYEVEVEEIIGDKSSASMPVAIPQTPTPVQVTAEQSAPKAAELQAAAGSDNSSSTPQHKSEPVQTSSNAGPLGSLKVNAPMPGTILDIRVNAGDTIKKGQVVLILEAMKMENEIMAPEDGKITSINTSKGASVNSGDLLFTLN
jgi:biotin carboxyl carrier protein